MQNIPSTLIVSSSNTKPKSLIKLITKRNPDEHPSGVISQIWKIDTKYYTADTNIIGISENYARNTEFNDNVEALIVLMDCNKQSGLEDLQKWESIENECEPEVKLLVSNYCNDNTKISRNQVSEWCLKRSFEFVELYPTKTEINDDDSEPIIEEKFGVNRIIEALEAHTWSNLIMKSKTNIHKTTTNQAINHEDELQSVGSPLDNEDSEYSRDAVDDFTELFSQLHMMKDSLQTMPVSQRKQCAEQMVTAFWKAIGGEEEELLDI